MTVAKSKAYTQMEEIARIRREAPLNLPNPGTALIVVDMQRYFLRADSALSRLMEARSAGYTEHMMTSLEREVVPNVRRLVEGFRALGLPILWTALASARPDGSDLNSRLRAMNDVASKAGLPVAFPHRDDPWSGFTDTLAPADGETVVHKTTYGTFASTDLEGMLREWGLTTLVLCGVVTNVCVETTAREAVDRNFDVTLVEDACGAHVPEVHHTHLLSFQMPFGLVQTADAVLQALGTGDTAPQPQR